MVKPHCFPRLTLFSMSTIFIKKSYIILIKDTHRKNTYSNKTWVLTESMNMVIWVVCTLNQLFIRHCYTQIKFSKKKKQVSGKIPFFLTGAFCKPHSVCLNTGCRQGRFLWKCIFNCCTFNRRKILGFFIDVFIFQNFFFSKLKYWNQSKSPVIVT